MFSNEINEIFGEYIENNIIKCDIEIFRKGLMKITTDYHKKNTYNKPNLKTKPINKKSSITKTKIINLVSSNKIIEEEVITNYKDWISSFGTNNNTGVQEEIKTGIAILIGAQLITNNELPEKYKNIKNNGIYENIKGIINLSQLDNIGGTGDIGIKYNDESIYYFSVTQWKNQIAKCIRNPSAKSCYNLNKSPDLEDMNNNAYTLAVNYRKEHFGSIPNKKWKRIPKCPGSKMMCGHLSKKASDSWNNMEKEKRLLNLIKILDLDDKLTPNANGIIYWNNTTNSIEHIYSWKLNIDLEEYLDTFSEGIYIYHGKVNDIILKTQAKYNNGIIEGMVSKIPEEEWKIKKSKNYLSSWDTVAPSLNKIFTMNELKLSELNS